MQNSIPRLVKGFEGTKVIYIACGQLHSAAVTGLHYFYYLLFRTNQNYHSETNQVFTWGWGAGGCLGHGDMRYQLVPRLVTSLQGEDILSAAAGWKHTLVIKCTYFLGSIMVDANNLPFQPELFQRLLLTSSLRLTTQNTVI